MLLRFSVSNFASIADEQELLLTATSLSGDGVDLLYSPIIPRHAVLPSILIYGPNASGKSTLLSALQMMVGMVENSHQKGGPKSKLPYDPFKLEDVWKGSPTSFELEFILSDLRYCYSFAFLEDQITAEKLTVNSGGGTSLLFSRSGTSFVFGRKLTGNLKSISGITRPNSLFLSAAAQNNHELLTRVHGYLTSFSFENSTSPAAINAQMRISNEFNHRISEKVISFLSNIGTGVVSYQAVDTDETEEQRERSKKFNDALKAAFSSAFGNEFEFPDDDIPRKKIELGHQAKDGEIVYLSLDDESAGTRRLLTTLPAIFRSLETGGLLILDEVDASLHTLAADLVMALFAHKVTNPLGAQIIATTHDTNLLDSMNLRRDQVWFAEKTFDGKTRLYPLSDFKPRKGENMERGYLQGRYGAIPRGSIAKLIQRSEAKELFENEG